MDNTRSYYESLEALPAATERWIGAFRRAAAAAGAFDPEGTAPEDPACVALFAEQVEALAAAMTEMPGLAQLLQVAVGKDLARTMPAAAPPAPEA